MLGMQKGCSEFDNIVEGSVNGSDRGDAIMLFGVRLNDLKMRKVVSLNNISNYDQESNSNDPVGYLTDGAVHESRRNRERKRGNPWTVEEHRLFLLGLEKVGKGDWRGISRNFVKSRTPTQVASHAQKYFLRKKNISRRRRGSSVFDLAPEPVTRLPSEEANPLGSTTCLHSPSYAGVDVMPCCPGTIDFGLNQTLSPESSPLNLELSLSWLPASLPSSNPDTVSLQLSLQSSLSLNSTDLGTMSGSIIPVQ